VSTLAAVMACAWGQSCCPCYEAKGAREGCPQLPWCSEWKESGCERQGIIHEMSWASGLAVCTCGISCTSWAVCSIGIFIWIESKNLKFGLITKTGGHRFHQKLEKLS
jgi:hypothetical protein